MDKALQRAFEPAQLGKLTLRNRIIKAATFEGKTPKGIPGKALKDFHLSVCEGGVGMTTIAYCATEPDGRIHEDMILMNESVRPEMESLIADLHATGAKVSGQLGHCGNFSRNKNLQRLKRPQGPSPKINNLGLLVGMPFTAAMAESDIATLVQSYHDAAAFMQEVGFDAIEMHFGHGYALSQFLSPLTNKRRDQYGGSIENRMRVPLKAYHAVRTAVGDKLPILAKISMHDGVRGGLSIEDSLASAKMLDQAGVDAIIPSAGTSSYNPMPMFLGKSLAPGIIDTAPNAVAKWLLKFMAPKMFRDKAYKELYLLEQHKHFRDHIKNAKMVYVGGCHTANSLQQVMQDGIDFVQVGRALIKDPDYVKNAQQQGINYNSGCDHCNYCVTSIDRVGGVHCVHHI